MAHACLSEFCTDDRAHRSPPGDALADALLSARCCLTLEPRASYRVALERLVFVFDGGRVPFRKAFAKAMADGLTSHAVHCLACVVLSLGPGG